MMAILSICFVMVFFGAVVGIFSPKMALPKFLAQDSMPKFIKNLLDNPSRINVIKIYGGLFFVLLLIAGILGSLNESGNNVSRDNPSDIALSSEVEKCVNAALSYGYEDGQCAYGFIDVCVKTGSRSKMKEAFTTDQMLGMAKGGGCVNMPTTYKGAFNLIAAKHDRL